MTATVTRWWWVRHALVTANEGRIYGRSDLPCETDDTEMFEGLAEILPSDAVLVTSDLMRTHQTADAIKAAGLEMAPRIEIPDLAEQSFGDWQGQHFADIQKEMPVKLHDFWMCPAHYRPPGGESFVDLIARVAPQIERISEEYPGRHIIAVTHGGTIRAALAIALGLDPERALSFTIENLSVTRIDRIETGSDDPTPGAGQLNWRTVLVNRMGREPETGMEADPMSPDLVVQNLVIIGAIALVVYYLTVRAKRRRALATYTLAYAFHAEAMANADADFLATFGAALPANATGTVLMRFSLLNRGKDKDIARDDFLTPVEIAFPSESIVRHANAVEKNGAADPAAVRTEISGNRVLVHPFDLPQRSSVIFNIVLDGSASPMDVSGRLKAQDAPEPLS